MPYVLALDQGTTSSRAILFDRAGRAVGTGQREFPQIFPQPGWVEHDPADLWSSQLAAAQEAVAAAGATFEDVVAIGIANQRETTVVWDRRTGEPVCNAIVWQDRRTASACDALREAGHEGLFAARTGLRLDPYFSGTKLAWILDNVPGVRRRAEAGELAFGTVDTWLVWNLTGGSAHVTDATNAARTLLLDIHTGRWDEELLGILRIPPSLLPEVRGCSEVVATTDPAVLGAAVPIAGMMGDQQAALFGQACVRRGMAKTTYGTGCFMLMHTGAQAVASKSGLLTTIASRIGDSVQYALEGSVFAGGAVVQWLRDGLGLIAASADVEALAAGVPDSGGVVLVPAFAGLGAPHWDPYARGLMAGLTRGTTAGHIARAALESIALQVADVLEAMEADAGLRVPQLRVDGGAAANNLLMQLQADILSVPVVRPVDLETTAIGAAALAGLAVGFWSDLDHLAGRQGDRTFTPAMAPERMAALRADWRKAVDRAKGWEH